MSRRRGQVMLAEEFAMFGDRRDLSVRLGNT